MYCVYQKCTLCILVYVYIHTLVYMYVYTLVCVFYVHRFKLSISLCFVCAPHLLHCSPLQVALHFVKDERTRFALGIECGNLDVSWRTHLNCRA